MTNILFLCTGNSARSIMAESYLNHIGNGYCGFSAGSNPTGMPNPLSIKTLNTLGIEAIAGDGRPAASKSWDVFADPDAPVMDVVITVCDNAAGEVCPIWPILPGGEAPQKLHWSFPDPAAVEGSEAQRLEAFSQIFTDIRAKIDMFLAERGA